MRLLFALILLLSTFAQAREPSDLRSFGESDKTTLYLFTSPSCQHCAIFHKNIFPDLIKQYANKNRAKVSIVDMPSDATTMQAVMLLRCLPEDKAERMTTWLYQNQSKWVNAPNATDQFQRYALSIGFPASSIKECLNNKDLRDDIVEQRNNLSSLYRVAGTPTVIMRQGNVAKQYTGTNRRAILVGLETDIRAAEGLKTKK